MKLTSKRVEEIMASCLFKDEELEEGQPEYIKAEGIAITAGFHPERLEAHKEEIIQLLNELPWQFMTPGGGGWSFLNTCNDKHGVQWTGLHEVMDKLFMLGIGIGKVKCLMPRDMWDALPGGMPYYSIECKGSVEIN